MLNYSEMLSIPPFSMSSNKKENWYLDNQKILCKYHYSKCAEYKNIVDRKRPKIQTKTVFSEPILSSYLPRIKHPIIPDKLINTPRKRIWDSENSNRKEANILAKAKILITALLKKK